MKILLLCCCSQRKSEAGTWFDERKFEFAACSFLNAGLARYGDITNNSAEQTNSAIRKARRSPIVNMCVALARLMSQKFWTRWVFKIK